MNRILIALVLIAIALTPVAPSPNVEAASPYCTTWAQQPYSSGGYTRGGGGFNCNYGGVVSPHKIQVCLFQDNVLVVCKTNWAPNNYGSLAVSCWQTGGTYRWFQSWTWIQDRYGNTESVWSAGSYNLRC